MNQYVTNQSKHCYYGNIANILNYYGILISEAELVLLSDELNCSSIYHNNHLFFGISNEKYINGLSKLNCTIENVTSYNLNIINTYLNILKQGHPILLLINSGKLNYSYIFKGTNRSHYIVMIYEKDNRVLISDSFIQTIPQTIFQGYVSSNLIYKEIESGTAQGIYIKQNFQADNIQNEIKNAIDHYLYQNINIESNNVLSLMKNYTEIAINNMSDFLNKEVLCSLSYEIKVAGCVARCDYLLELFSKYFQIDNEIKQEIIGLKIKWELIASKIMKCSITLSKDYYIKIFTIEIPVLIEKEKTIYKKISKIGE